MIFNLEEYEIIEMYVKELWFLLFQTVAISKKFTDLHAQVSPTIVKLMKKAVETGAPLNAPIWWLDPTNTYAHKVNDGEIHTMPVKYCKNIL